MTITKEKAEFFQGKLITRFIAGNSIIILENSTFLSKEHRPVGTFPD